MRLYLDDDTASALLVRRLRQAGHDVQVPADVGTAGEEDPVHLAHAVTDDRSLISHNHHDFENLHNLLLIAHGHHAGILIVRRDNDPRRDMTAADVVRALRKLLAAAVPVADHFHILNHWR